MTIPSPGEIRFNSDLEHDLREGRSVLLRLPEGETRELIERTRQVFRDDWIDLSASEDGRAPLDQLFDEFEPNRTMGVLKTLSRLYQLDNFRGRVLAIHFQNDDCWKNWIPFLREFANASRTVEEFYRTRLVLVCIGRNVGGISHVNELLLSERSLDGYFGRIDSRLAANQIVLRTNRTALECQIVESICSELALWDTALAAQLAELPVGDLFDPLPVLLQLAEELGFRDAAEVPVTEGLWRGWFRTVDQSGEWHSCHLALTGRGDLIRNRVWRAQTASILPFLEGQRKQLISIFRNDLRLPHRDREGKVLVTDWDDLELGHIFNQFFSPASRVSETVRQAVKLLRDVRNLLAHFQPITPDFVHRGLLARMPWEDLA